MLPERTTENVAIRRSITYYAKYWTYQRCAKEVESRLLTGSRHVLLPLRSSPPESVVAVYFVFRPPLSSHTRAYTCMANLSYRCRGRTYEKMLAVRKNMHCKASRLRSLGDFTLTSEGKVPKSGFHLHIRTSARIRTQAPPSKGWYRRECVLQPSRARATSNILDPEDRHGKRVETALLLHGLWSCNSSREM